MDLHHLHVWQIDENYRALEAHVTIARDRLNALESIKTTVKKALHDRFSIEHATLEFEIAGEGCPEESRHLISRHA